MPDEVESRTEKLKILLDAVRHKYDTVADVENSLSNRLSILLGFEVTVMVGYASFAFSGLEGLNLILAVAGVVILGTSVVILLTTHFFRRNPYTYPSSITTAKEHFEKSEEDLLQYLIDAGHRAIERNRERRHKKRKFYHCALKLLIIALPLLILAKIPLPVMLYRDTSNHERSNECHQYNFGGC